MSKKRVIPRLATTPRKAISGNEPANERDNMLRPAWRFSTVDRNGAFAWPDSQEALKAIHDFLCDIDGKTWGELLHNDQGGSHDIEFSRMSPMAQQRLTALNMEEKADGFLMSLRMTGKKRLFCYITESTVANLLWYDPDHQVCPSPKKHT